MKRQIFMYLFIFSLLLVVFQYVNSKNILENQGKKVETLKEKVAKYSDSLTAISDDLFELSYFELDHNDNALTYFENRGLDINVLSSLLKDKLFNSNQMAGEEHPIIPYASMTEDKIVIDNMRVLNHRWIIASFTDGQYGGEMFLTYEVGQENKVSFNVVESFLYPIN